MNTATQDNITEYTVPASRGMRLFCTSCYDDRPTWTGLTEGGEELTCCAVCQRVLIRNPSPARRD